jgi:cyanate permease
VVQSGVLTIAFAAWEIYLSRPDSPILPLLPVRLFKSRTTVGTIIFMGCIFSSLNIPVYYLPLFYEIVRGRTAEQSGVDIIPLLISFILTTTICGGVVRKTGRYWPFLVISTCIAAVGGGMLYTIDPTTSNSRLIGFQILVGIGIGFGFQNSSMTECLFCPYNWTNDQQ